MPAPVTKLSNTQMRIWRNCVAVIDYGGDVVAQLSLMHDWVPRIRRAVWHTIFCEKCVMPAHCEMIAPALDEYTLLTHLAFMTRTPRSRHN